MPSPQCATIVNHCQLIPRPDTPELVLPQFVTHRIPSLIIVNWIHKMTIPKPRKFSAVEICCKNTLKFDNHQIPTIKC